MSKFIRNVLKTDTMTLTECNDGYYLYDKIQEYNLVMRAKSEHDVYIEAILNYQKDYAKLQKEHKALREKVDSFVSQFITNESETIL